MTKIQDVDLRALLRELAGNPRSHLLQVRRAPIELGLGARVSSRAALLSAAERELLDTYRCEVAQLLKEAARACLLEDSRTQAVLHRSHTGDRDLVVTSREGLAQQAERMALLGADGDGFLSDVELVRTCVGTPERGVASAIRLARAAVRLTGDPEAKTLAAVGLYFLGRKAEARDALGMILHDRPAALLRSIVLEFLALGYWERGSHEDALVYYRQAFQAHTDRIAPLVFWFVCSARVDSRAELLEAGNRLESFAGPDHPLISALSEGVLPISPWTAPSNASLPDLLSGFGPVASKVAHVLLES